MVEKDRKESAPSPVASPTAHSSQPTKLEQSTLVSARIWDVFTPPPTNTFVGTVVPRAFSKYSRRRRISVDVYRVRVSQPAEVSSKNTTVVHDATTAATANKTGGSNQTLLNAENATYYEECVVRVLVPSDKSVEKASRKEGIAARLRRKKGLPVRPPKAVSPNGTTIGEMHHDDVSLLDIDDDHADDSSVASTVDGVPEEFVDTGPVMIPQLAGWKPKYRFPVGYLTIEGQHKTGVSIVIQIGQAKQTRELVFDSRPDANAFVELIEEQQSLETVRTERKLKASLGSVVLKPKEEITFLIEIVSGWHIPAGDITSSDPYVKCLIQGKEVHRTKYIPKTLDPIWTLKTNSLFLLKIESRELFLSEGLVCELMDFDTIGAHEKLGVVVVPPSVIYEASGKRLEFKIQPPNSKIKEVPGLLAIRCRRATDYDIEFLKHYNDEEKNKEQKHIQTDVKNKLGGGLLHTLVTKNVKKEKVGPDAGQKKYRIRPGPDPKRIEATEWMTKEQIDEEILKESQYWIDAGSGNLGRLHVEVLRCEGLPNLDVGSLLGNKTDAFVALVYQDTFVRTDVIDDCLNPRWLPWTQRAFAFRILHTSSQLFLGVFDYDGGLDDHDPIGRVSVDVSNFRPNTVYTVTYTLYPTAQMQMSYRQAKGSITLRLRVEIDDYRKFLLSTLEPPPEVYVNVKTKRDFRVVKFVCGGKIDMDAYSTKVIESYIDELLANKQATFYLKDAAIGLLMWHGHFDVKIAGTTYTLPVHSITAFFTAILLVERPQLFPAFGFAFIAWCLFAIMEWRINIPDPWSRCKSYSELAEALVLGVSTAPPHTIAPFENKEETEKMLHYWETRIAKEKEKAEKAEEQALKDKEELDQELEDLGENETDITTKKSSGVSIDPLKPVLYPIQKYLGLICQCLRVIKFVLYWEECYFAFWIATGCLILSFAFLFVPWFWIIKWTSRIIVWSVFGPWLKLVDMFYWSRAKVDAPINRRDSLMKQETIRIKKKETVSKRVFEARLKKESAQKLKAMKKYLFGRFITKVPILKQDRYRDVPLPQSKAEPYTPEPVPLSELAMKEAGYRRTRLPGQQLVGDMIPQVQSLTFTDAPKGKATASPKLLDQNGPGGDVRSGAESTSAAYAKIGSVVVAAGIVTWFVVPLMGSVAEHVLNKF